MDEADEERGGVCEGGRVQKAAGGDAGSRTWVWHEHATDDQEASSRMEVVGVGMKKTKGSCGLRDDVRAEGVV